MVFFSLISSYIGHGTYTMTDDRLVLETDAGDGFVYAFTVQEDTLIFDEDASTGFLWYSGITDGTVFEKVLTLPEGVDVTAFGKGSPAAS